MQGTPYDFVSTLFFQLIKQVSKRKRWYGLREGAYRRLYCSEACALVLNKSTRYIAFRNYYEITPADLDKSEFMREVEL